jgi:Tfp pilus assembly protein PilF
VSAARGFFVDAVAANSRHADAHYGLGYTAATQGDHPTAIRHYCKALEHGSGNLEIERDVPPLLKQVGGSCN